ncbi:MAG: hypothetical protein JW904_04755 [Spirochaetales bacterium]|nr:hypothetical protein [Spirochaetales bacterium]
MELVVRLVVSFFAGFLSFLTPCVLPLVPSYITFLGGTTVQELNSSQYNRKRIFVRAIFFVSGFTIVFTLAGTLLWGAFAAIGTLSQTINAVINIIAGSIIILLGLNIIFDFFSFLNREKRADMSTRPENNISALLMGMTFAAGWSPCIGPILSGIVALTATSYSVFGIFGLLLYSLGLGIPFLLLGLAFVPVSRKLGNMKKYFPVIKIVSGSFLIVVGIFMLLGRFIAMNVLFFEISQLLRTMHGDFWLMFYIFFAVLYGGIAGLAGFRFIKNLFFSQERHVSFFAIFVFIVFFTLFLLQITAVISTELLVAEWFLVQEISPFTGH